MTEPTNIAFETDLHSLYTAIQNMREHSRKLAPGYQFALNMNLTEMADKLRTLSRIYEQGLDEKKGKAD